MKSAGAGRRRASATSTAACVLAEVPPFPFEPARPLGGGARDPRHAPSVASRCGAWPGRAGGLQLPAAAGRLRAAGRRRAARGRARPPAAEPVLQTETGTFLLSALQKPPGPLAREAIREEVQPGAGALGPPRPRRAGSSSRGRRRATSWCGRSRRRWSATTRCATASARRRAAHRHRADPGRAVVRAAARAPGPQDGDRRSGAEAPRRGSGRRGPADADPAAAAARAGTGARTRRAAGARPATDRGPRARLCPRRNSRSPPRPSPRWSWTFRSTSLPRTPTRR